VTALFSASVTNLAPPVALTWKVCEPVTPEPSAVDEENLSSSSSGSAVSAPLPSFQTKALSSSACAYEPAANDAAPLVRFRFPPGTVAWVPAARLCRPPPTVALSTSDVALS
jgi:hypothetical protein